MENQHNIGDVYSINLLDGEHYDLWDRYVRSDPRASLYHLSIWKAFIENTVGHNVYYLNAMSSNGNQVIGVLPLVRLKSLYFGDYMVSMPFFNYGGALAISKEIEAALMSKACSLAKDLDVDHIEFRDISERDEAWQVRNDKIIMELELPKTEDELWSGFTSKLRAQIRRPSKENNVTSIIGGVELLRDFYSVFSRNMRDLGTPVYSISFFSKILDTFPESSHIVLVKLGTEPVAAGFLLGHKDRMEIPWASSVRKYNSMGFNMLMYWEALKFSIEKGYKIFDYGRSTLKSGTYRFKKQWGAKPKQLYWHYWLNEGRELPRLTPDNPKYKIAIAAWQHLPLIVTNWLGPKIVKNLP